MKINERDALSISKPQSDRLFEAQKLDGRSSSAAPSPRRSSDAIELGSQSRLAAQALAAGSEERASRIEQLRALVQSGRYQVDHEALSRAIVGAAISGY